MPTDDFTIARLTVLHDHGSQETAYYIADHPYGYRLRCQMRYWLETAVKGQYKQQTRMIRQSTNPRRGDNWNPPKAHTNFAPFMVMYADPAAQSRAGEDYVKTLAHGPYLRPADLDHIKLCGAYEQLTEQQRKRFDALVANSQAAGPSSWAKWAEWKDRPPWPSGGRKPHPGAGRRPGARPLPVRRRQVPGAGGGCAGRKEPVMAGVKRAGSRVMALHAGTRGTTLSPGLSLGTVPTEGNRRNLQILIQDGDGGFTVLDFSVSPWHGYVSAAGGETAEECERRGIWAALEAEAARRARPATAAVRQARQDGNR